MSVVTIGNAYNPDGGIFTRLGFLPTIPPPLDITFGPAMPTDTGIPITSIGFQYDPVMYAPVYWGNPFSIAECVGRVRDRPRLLPDAQRQRPDRSDRVWIHAWTELADRPGEDLPGPELSRRFQRQQVLHDSSQEPAASWTWSCRRCPAPFSRWSKPFVDLVSPVLKVLVDLGYDWSGDPGKQKFLSPLPFNPFQNWLAVGVNLVVATVQGIQAFIGDLGAERSRRSHPTPQ